MYTNRLLQDTEPTHVLEFAKGASRFGHREISGDVPSTGERVRLLCWSIVMEQDSAAFNRYQEIVQMLAEVDGKGLATASLESFEADRFGNMSERPNLLGELATVWVTGTRDGGEKRGAVLAAVDGVLLQILALTEYEAEGTDRAPHVIERIVIAMAARQQALELEPWADVMSRLPLLGDVEDSLENAAITWNRYGLPRQSE